MLLCHFISAIVTSCCAVKLYFPIKTAIRFSNIPYDAKSAPKNIEQENI